jgi:hypothetical protein
MDVYHQMFDGSLRPHWAGPVTMSSRRRSLGHGKQGHAIEVEGVVVPVHVPGRFLPQGAHRHTFGMGLGFPDLSGHLLHPSRDPAMAKSWAGMEQAIAGAAAKTMGWDGSMPSRNVRLTGLPPYALHLRMSGMIPRNLGQKSGDHEPIDPEHLSLTGELTKVFPIRDVSGVRFRMQTTGSPSSFKVSPGMANWSRDPGAL